MSGFLDNLNLKNIAVGVLAPAVTMFDPRLGALIAEANADFADGKIDHEEFVRLLNKSCDEAVHLFPQLTRVVTAFKNLILQGEPLVTEALAAVKELSA